MYGVVLLCNLAAPFNCLELKFELQSPTVICSIPTQGEIVDKVTNEYPSYQVKHWGCARGPRMAKL